MMSQNPANDLVINMPMDSTNREGELAVDKRSSVGNEPEVVAEEALAPPPAEADEKNAEARNELQLWLKGLNDDDRVAALSFRDGAFLATMVKLASPPSAAPTVGHADSPRYDGTEINWGVSCAMEEVVRVYEKEVGGDRDNEKDLSLDIVQPSVEELSNTEAPAEDLSRAVAATTASTSETEEEEEGLRIRRQEDSVAAAEASTTTGAAAAATASVPPGSESSTGVHAINSRDSDEAEQPPAFMENVHVVQPPAVERVADSVADSPKIPCVTLYGSETQSEQDLVVSLDTAYQCLFGKPFLAMNRSTDLHWIDTLKQHAEKADRVPLYGLFLLRLETAVVRHYETTCRNAETGVILETSSGVDISTHKFSDAQVVRELLNLVHNQSGGAVATVAAIDAALEVGTSVSEVAPAKNADMDPEVTVNAETPERPILVPLVGMNVENLRGEPVPVEEIMERETTLTICTSPDPVVVQQESTGVKVEDSAIEEAQTPGDAAPVSRPNAKAVSENGFSGQKKKKKKKNKRKNKNKSADNNNHVSESAAKAKEPKEELCASSTPEVIVPTVVAPPEVGKPRANGVDIGEEKTEVVALEPDVSSVKSEASFQDAPLPPKDPEVDNNAGITVSRVEGVLVVAPPSGTTQDSIVSNSDPTSQHQMENDDGSAWETVGTRSRGGRKKSNDRTNGGAGGRVNTPSPTTDTTNANKKPKEKRTAASRRRNANRKIAREILSGILDAVDEEAGKKKDIPQFSVSGNRWTNGPPISVKGGQQSISLASDQPAPVSSNAKQFKDEKSLRDVVLGRHSQHSNSDQVTSSAKESKRGSNTPKQSLTNIAAENTPKNRIESAKVQQIPRVSARGASTPADQNTAPTYQETVSAVSGTSNIPTEKKDYVATLNEPVPKSDSSSAETDEAPQNRDRGGTTSGKEQPPAPPLPTLLSPENANSATSSVASSLEAPHGHRHHHHSSTGDDVKDVGYHLLDVCDRLSRDMSLFMRSRAQALNVRRSERAALLSALQETLSGIWPNMCHVEMYGSCATMLDLPSSDLDVVVMGLDRSEMIMSASSATQQSLRKRSSGDDSMKRTSSEEDRGHVQQSQSMHSVAPTYVPLPLYTTNGQRVRRLAAEIERLPWAVKVKSIPNATVPVIKILADPAKIPGSVSLTEWSMPPYGYQMPYIPGEQSSSFHKTPNQGNHSSHHIFEPWRGSDVMNGLISLDITFDGPEHGGIGSTEFSLHAVNQVCTESGLLPEETPFVQCLMVLKELLAQRKLNEPYSGGLGSYALLLLLVALVRERGAIRQEIERVEMLRQEMMAGVGSLTSSTQASTNPGIDQSSENSCSWNQDHKRNGHECAQPGLNDRNESLKVSVDPSSQSNVWSASSWASIARSSGSTSTKSDKAGAPIETPNRTETKAKREGHGRSTKPVSFADAVGRSHGVAPGLASSSPQRPSGSGEDTMKVSNGSEATADVRASQTSSYSSMDPLSIPSIFPQGFNDVIEVLCSGEVTAGKLLMHFLLHYGQYFDSQATAIDISGKHERTYTGPPTPYSYMTPYIKRRSPETIDPTTGMLVIDQIVVYDPLEGEENHNVARRCFAWQQVKWIFAQSYATLSSAVERSAAPSSSHGGTAQSTPIAHVPASTSAEIEGGKAETEATGDLMDPSSPLLRCLLSF